MNMNAVIEKSKTESHLDTEAQSPVFIIGVLNRSGTNFLSDILLQYPGLEMPLLKEDYILEHSELLVKYARSTQHRWRRRLGEQEGGDLVLRSLGEGLYQFLRTGCEQADSRLILKTPRAFGMGHLWEFFPKSKMLIIVRDGRDTVESAAKTFTYLNHGDWMKEWRTGARLTLEFMQGPAAEFENTRWKLVKYEQLIETPRAVIPEILEFLGCSPELYDWEKFENLPVRGSSTVRRPDGQLSWDPVEKPEGFKPVAKWKNWPWWRRQQFKWIVGRELIAFGYEHDNNW